VRGKKVRMEHNVDNDPAALAEGITVICQNFSARLMKGQFDELADAVALEVTRKEAPEDTRSIHNHLTSLEGLKT